MEESAGEEVTEIEESSIGRAHETFFVSTDSARYVFKSSLGDERFQVEAPVMEMLGSETGVSVPRIVDFDNSMEESDFMWFLAEFIDGENLDDWESDSGPSFKYLSRERKKKILRSAGRELGKLHTQTCFRDFGFFQGADNELKLRQTGDWERDIQEDHTGGTAGKLS